MKARKWKSVRGMPYGLELQYRIDDGELCWEYEEQLVAIAANSPGMCSRQGVAQMFSVKLGRREIEFIVVPGGTLPILEADLDPRIIEGFLNGPGNHLQDRLH